MPTMIRRYRSCVFACCLIISFIIVKFLSTYFSNDTNVITVRAPTPVWSKDKIDRDRPSHGLHEADPSTTLHPVNPQIVTIQQRATFSVTATVKPNNISKTTSVKPKNISKTPAQKTGKYDGDILIVGAGLSSAVMAHLHTVHFNKRVIVIEKRDHIGGNVYDFVNELGIRVSKYGAHLFHTKVPEVWRYVSQFSEWVPYYHRVIGNIDNKLVPIPVNIDTVNSIMNQTLYTVADMNNWLERNQIKNPNPRNGEEAAQARVGKVLYEKIFKSYTMKQWSKDPKELDASVLQRIPVRNDWDDRYFPDDQYQALPKNGYTQFVSKMFQHPNITYHVNTDFFKLKSSGEISLKNYERIIFTGPIDQYFSNSGLDTLEYRSINFLTEHLSNLSLYQPKSVVNHPQGPERFTRIVEYKHMYGQTSTGTTIVKEFSTDKGDPYYPVPNDRNKQLYEKYKRLALKEEKEKNVHFVGRLASYKYFNMDQAILNAINEFKRIYANVSFHNELMFGDMTLDKANGIFVKSAANPSLSIIISHCMENITRTVQTFVDKCAASKVTFYIYQKCGDTFVKKGALQERFPMCRFKIFPVVNVTQDAKVFLYHILSKSFLFDDVNAFVRGNISFSSVNMQDAFTGIQKELFNRTYADFKKLPVKALKSHIQFFQREMCVSQYPLTSEQKVQMCRWFVAINTSVACSNFFTSFSNFMVTEVALRRVLSRHTTLLFSLYKSIGEQNNMSDKWLHYLWIAFFRAPYLDTCTVAKP